MSTYAIGDVQGCFSILRRLLKKLKFNPHRDFLWFCGDIVNRGPESLATLKFIKALVQEGSALMVLGNHDLHLLAVGERIQTLKPSDTLTEILSSPQKVELLHWLRQQPLCHYDAKLDYFLVHAGLVPQWSIEDALTYADEVSSCLKDDARYKEFLSTMYGDEPSLWSETLSGFERLRFIINVFTRIRFCSEQGQLNLRDKTLLGSQKAGTLPWFSIKDRKSKDKKIIFGHWAALYKDWDKVKSHTLFPIDSGCVWGNALTALCLETQERFSIHLK